MQTAYVKKCQDRMCTGRLFAASVPKIRLEEFLNFEALSKIVGDNL